MKYLIVSDIHGSKDSCEFIYNEFKNGKYDKILCLGDVLYHGPRNDLPENYNPKGCIEILNKLKDDIICVKGNCDAEVDQMVLSFEILDSYDFEIDEHLIHLEHGHHLDEYCGQARLIMSGHTHIPVLNKEANCVYLNPGSITIPKGGYKRSFAVMDEEKIKVLDLDRNVIFEMEKRDIWVCKGIEDLKLHAKERGREEGIILEREDNVYKLYCKGISKEEISNLLDLSLDDVNRIIASKSN